MHRRIRRLSWTRRDETPDDSSHQGLYITALVPRQDPNDEDATPYDIDMPERLIRAASVNGSPASRHLQAYQLPGYDTSVREVTFSALVGAMPISGTILSRSPTSDIPTQRTFPAVIPA